MNSYRPKQLVIGSVIAPFGTNGAVRVRSYSGESDHFVDLGRVQLRRGEQSFAMDIETIRCPGTMIIVKFTSVDSIDEADQIRGYELLVRRRHASRLRRREFYVADLCGCLLHYRQRPIGIVVSVWESGACSNLEIDTGERQPLIVPFRSEFIGRMQLRLRRIALKNDWLLQ